VNDARLLRRAVEKGVFRRS